MTALLRAITILWICCRYRLDTLTTQKLPLALRMVFALFPEPNLNRGERLRMACEKLGPIFVKFGQLFQPAPI